MKFTKKNPHVEAIRFTADTTVRELQEWAGLLDHKPGDGPWPFRCAAGAVYVYQPNGEELRANLGDWIVKLPKGSFIVYTDPMFMEFFEPSNLAALAASPESVRANYDELIGAVASIWPGESRHQTALRYIRQAEDRIAAGADNQPKAG